MDEDVYVNRVVCGAKVEESGRRRLVLACSCDNAVPEPIDVELS